jgi:hypothetical protein
VPHLFAGHRLIGRAGDQCDGPNCTGLLAGKFAISLARRALGAGQ